MATSAPLRLPKVTTWRNLRRNCRLVRVFERGGANPFLRYRLERVVDQRLLKVAFQCRHGFRGSFAPVLSPSGEPFASLGCTLGLVNRTGLFQLFALLFALELAAGLVDDIAQLVKEAVFFQHCRAVDEGESLSSPATAIAHDHLQPLLWSHPSLAIRRLSSFSHSVCSSLLAISQSMISRLPLPSFQNPRATRTTTRWPLRSLRRRMPRSGFSFSVWV